MAAVSLSATLADVRKTVRDIVEHFRPLKVILFGSHAYGEPSAESDVDLLVVMETDGNPIHTAARIAASIKSSFDMDIVVVRPKDWDEYLSEGAIFATQVATKGLVLYEARNS